MKQNIIQINFFKNKIFRSSLTKTQQKLYNELVYCNRNKNKIKQLHLCGVSLTTKLNKQIFQEKDRKRERERKRYRAV